jgi:drug/metabolite transporter (DMT)-like permease
MLLLLVRGSARRDLTDSTELTDPPSRNSRRRAALLPSSWIGPLALLCYAVPFTLAYVRLGAATGAIVLFGSVQLSMIGWGVAHGERLRPLAWLGFALAIAGLLALVAPGAQRLDPLGALLMMTAGVAWGAYSIVGRGVTDVLRANALSFAWSTPAGVACWVIGRGSIEASPRGVVLAVCSGAVASGIGYAIWYRALRGLSTTRAAAVQVSVPVIAALAAVPLLGEPLTLRLSLCGTAVVAGILLVIRVRA